MIDAVRVDGHGVHSGTSATATLHARPGPVAFRRAGRTIAPRHDRIVSNRSCTVLGEGPARVAVVEHLLAALQVRGVWHGLLIECDSDELPILDGSAEPWAEALDALPIGTNDATATAFRATVQGEDGAWADLRPGPVRAVAIDISYTHPAIGRQHWSGSDDRWEELLRARTFGFAADEARLRADGLAAGVQDGNVIVFDGEGPCVPLREPDEPVRHKALDALGDMYLLGRPFAGTLRVNRGSHALHHRLVKRSLASPEAPAGRP